MGGWDFGSAAGDESAAQPAAIVSATQTSAAEETTRITYLVFLLPCYAYGTFSPKGLFRRQPLFHLASQGEEPFRRQEYTTTLAICA